MNLNLKSKMYQTNDNDYFIPEFDISDSEIEMIMGEEIDEDNLEELLNEEFEEMKLIDQEVNELLNDSSSINNFLNNLGNYEISAKN